MVGDHVLVDLGQSALFGTHRSREVAEVVDHQRNISVQGLPDGLAVVVGLGHCQFLEVFLDRIRGLVHDDCPLARSESFPGRLSCVCRVQCQLDIGST